MEQREAGNAYSVLEHIDVMLLVEGELFVDSLEEGYDIAIVIPHEKVAHRLHLVVVPDGLAASVIGIRYSLVLQLTKEGRLWR